MENNFLPDLSERYIRYCSAIRNYTPQTVQSYHQTLGFFFRHSGKYYVPELNKEVFEQFFLSGRIDRKWSAATFHSHHKHINTFLKWLVKEKIIPYNYLDGLEKPRLEYRLPRTLSADKAQLVLDTAFHMKSQYRFQRYRNRALLAVMLFAGLRKNEAISLKLHDVSMEQRKILITQGKGMKDRIVPIGFRLFSILAEYLSERSKIKSTCVSFFLSSVENKNFTEAGVKKLIDALRKKTKLDFCAHTLRHSFATLMLEGGCDIYTLSKIMGHSKITTTTIYLQCSNQQMSKSIEMHTLN